MYSQVFISKIAVAEISAISAKTAISIADLLLFLLIFAGEVGHASKKINIEKIIEYF